MDDSEHMNVVAADLINQPVAEDKVLPNIRLPQFRNHATHQGLSQDQVAQVEGFGNKSPGLRGRITRNIGGNRIEIVERLGRPDYFSSHRESRALASSWVQL